MPDTCLIFLVKGWRTCVRIPMLLRWAQCQSAGEWRATWQMDMTEFEGEGNGVEAPDRGRDSLQGRR